MSCHYSVLYRQVFVLFRLIVIILANYFFVFRLNIFFNSYLHNKFSHIHSFVCSFISCHFNPEENWIKTFLLLLLRDFLWKHRNDELIKIKTLLRDTNITSSWTKFICFWCIDMKQLFFVCQWNTHINWNFLHLISFFFSISFHLWIQTHEHSNFLWNK